MRLVSLMGMLFLVATIFSVANLFAADVPLKITPMPINSELDEDDPLFVPSLSTVLPSRFYFSRKNDKDKFSIYFSKFLKKTGK